VDTTVNDVLGITSTAAETESPGTTASKLANQSIVIDNAQSSTDLNFQTNNQSIWDTGAAFNKDYPIFLGIDKSFSTSSSIVVASAGASAHIKAGVQADLKINAGDISATLPFDVSLDSNYNKTTDTLQVTPTGVQLAGGHFTAHGPAGSFTFGLDFGLHATAHASVVGISTSFSTTIGSFTHPVTSFSLKSTQLSTSISLPAGLSLTLAFPNVNTNGSGGPGTISGTGTSNDFINLSGDLIAMASDLIFGSDVTDLSIGGVIDIDILDLIVGIGLNVVQKFDVNNTGLVPTMMLEDGTLEPLPTPFGSGTLTIPNVSTHDANHDGQIGFSIGLVPQATLTNNTSLGVTANAGITALALSVQSIGSFTAFKASTNIQLGTFPPIFSKSFDLNGFNHQTVTQTV